LINLKNPMLTLRFVLIFVCSVLLASNVRAQAEVDDLPQSSEQVQIEVLVFRFPGKGAGSELKAGQTAASGVGQAIISGSELYSELESSERQLSGAFARVQASTDLKPLLFTAWRQNLSDARWVALKPASGGDSEQLSGRILLTPGKPLGLKLELQLNGAQLIGSTAGSARFRMRANRPAHFEETLYFDHPAFGALVRVDLSPVR
jgi:hypothetical protein